MRASPTHEARMGVYVHITNGLSGTAPTLSANKAEVPGRKRLLQGRTLAVLVLIVSGGGPEQ